MMDGPEDCTDKTMTQIGLYAHRGQDNRTSGDRLGSVTPATPPPRVPEDVDGLEGSAEEDE